MQVLEVVLLHLRLFDFAALVVGEPISVRATTLRTDVTGGAVPRQPTCLFTGLTTLATNWLGHIDLLQK